MLTLQPKTNAKHFVNSRDSYLLRPSNLLPTDIIPNNFNSPEELFFGNTDQTTINTTLSEILYIQGYYRAIKENMPGSKEAITGLIITEAGKYYFDLLEKTIAARNSQQGIVRSHGALYQEAERDAEAILSGLRSAKMLIEQKQAYEAKIADLQKQLAESQAKTEAEPTSPRRGGPGVFSSS